MKNLVVLSFGGGQDSTAIAYKIVHDQQFRAKYVGDAHVLAIMADTQDEHADTLEHVDEIAKFLEANGVEFVHLTSDRGHHAGAWAGGLRHAYRTYNAIGSVAYPKTCTLNLKIDPMYKFLEQYVAQRYGLSKTGRKTALKEYASIFGKLRVIIGIAKGEESRIADPEKEKPWAKIALEKVYPLVEEGMDRAACQEYIASVGKRVPPPSNCILCPFKSEEEILWTALMYPQHFDVWCELEANKIAHNADKVEASKNYGVKKHMLLPEIKTTTYDRLRPEFASDAALLEYLTEYRMSHGHCVASKM